MEQEIIVRIDWESEDGFQFIGKAEGHDWDVIATTSDAVATMEVGRYVWCTKTSNEEWGIHLKEVPFAPFATQEEWDEQEKLISK